MGRRWRPRGQADRNPGKTQHVIVLTDGVSEPADFEGIAQSMTQAKITCSTVAVGDDCDFKLLEEIARIGNGRYYASEDPTNIPQIFAKETVTASKSAINEQPFTPIVSRPTQVLAEIKFDEMPQLLGYVTTRPKRRVKWCSPARKAIRSSPGGGTAGDVRRVHLGCQGPLGGGLGSHAGVGKFWAQVVRHAMRKSDAKGTFLQMTQKDGKATALSIP